ncbi:MAG: transcription elongation factor Spt5 [Candidatus Hodarchaeota archaeon]
MARISIFTLRTTIGQEKNAAKQVEQRVLANRKLRIKSVLVPENVRGYLFIEGHPASLEKVLQGVRHVRSKIVGKVNIDDISDILIPRRPIEQVQVDDIVEVTGGPFRGSQAKISAVNQTKEEVTVVLLDSPVRIPVVIHADYVRILQSAEGDKDEVEA